MAIELGESTATVKRHERTCRIVIHTPIGGVPMIEISRERVTSVDGKVIARDEVAQITRSLSEIADKELTLRSRKFSGALVAEIVAAFADQWRGEDLAREAAEAKRQKEEEAEAAAESKRKT